MAKKPQTPLSPTDAAAPATGPALLRYVGPPDAEHPTYGALVPGRVYQEVDHAVAAYVVATHPDHWAHA